MEWSQKILRYFKNAFGLASPEGSGVRHQEDAVTVIATLDAIAKREVENLLEKASAEEPAAHGGVILKDCAFINYDRGGFVFDTLDPPTGRPGKSAAPEASLREFLGRDSVQNMRGKTVVAMKSPIRVLVCGGRSYNNQRMVFSTLDRIVRMYRPIAMIIHGDARTERPDGTICGADYFAGEWAKSRSVRCWPFPVTKREWRERGPAAGPMRNQKMLDQAHPDLVVAFPGGKGTGDMVRRARRAMVPVFDIDRLWGVDDGRDL